MISTVRHRRNSSRLPLLPGLSNGSRSLDIIVLREYHTFKGAWCQNRIIDRIPVFIATVRHHLLNIFRPLPYYPPRYLTFFVTNFADLRIFSFAHFQFSIRSTRHHSEKDVALFPSFLFRHPAPCRISTYVKLESPKGNQSLSPTPNSSTPSSS